MASDDNCISSAISLTGGNRSCRTAARRMISSRRHREFSRGAPFLGRPRPRGVSIISGAASTTDAHPNQNRLAANSTDDATTACGVPSDNAEAPSRECARRAFGRKAGAFSSDSPRETTAFRRRRDSGPRRARHPLTRHQQTSILDYMKLVAAVKLLAARAAVTPPEVPAA